MLKIKIGILGILAIVSAHRPCGAQTVDLQGTVTDRYGSKAAIQDADVTLIKAGLTARTDAEGKFHLRSASTGLGKSDRPGDARWVPGRGLIFRNLRAGNVSIGFLDPSGRARLRIADARLEAGLWSFNPSGLADGIYFVLLRTPESRIGFPIVQLGRGGLDAPPGYSRMEATDPLAKASGTLDSIKVGKAGYFVSGQAIANYVQSDLALTLADTLSNRAGLKALFPSSGSLQPNFDPVVLNYTLTLRESVSVLRFTPITVPADPLLFLQNGYDVSKMATGAPSDTIGLKLGHNPGIRIMSMSRDSSQLIYYDIDVLRVSDTSTGLTGLISNPTGFTPAFSPGQYVYRLAMPPGATAVSLTPTALPLCAVQVRGNPLVSGQTSQPMTVRPGIDTVPVDVWSPNNLVKATYRIITTRPQIDTSGLPALASLTVTPAGGVSPAFDPAVTTYHAWYPSGPSTLKIAAVASNPAHLVALPGRTPVAGWDTVTLSPGDSGNFSYDFKVATADGLQSKTYSLGVSKGTDRISTLNQINISPVYAALTPSFSPSQPNYSVAMRLKDSVVTVSSLPDHIAATTFYNGMVVPNLTKYTLSIKPSPQSTILNIMVVAQDGVTKSSYRFTFSRYPPLGVPQVNAPTAGLKDSVYLFSQVLPSGCVVGSPIQPGVFGYQMDFGDGTAPVTGSHGLYPLLDDIRRAYKAAGTYAIKVRSFCNYDTSAWSPPSPITIYDTAASPKIRLITGPHSVSETWYKDTTYLITGKTLFEKGTTLTIQPGTHIAFTDTGNYLMILGGFSAVGTATDSIRFDRANLRFSWTSSTGGTFNPDGSYLAGPRLEYCAIDGFLYFPDPDSQGGGWGVYLKNSRLRSITGKFFKEIDGSYIDHCRIDNLDGMNLSKSRVLNSHFVTVSIVAGKGVPVTIQKCDFGFLFFHSGDFTDSDISGNTVSEIGFANGAPGAMHGNNLQANPGSLIRAGAGSWDMQGNFWGDAATAEMNSKGPNQNISLIYDYLDDVGLGKLDYSAWKTALIPDAMPDWP